MLYRVIGASGSGKTEYILSRLGEALEKGKRCYVIVPEQQSVNYESAICERFGDSSNLLCETLNFERLPNRVARDFGDLAVNNIDKGGACALLSLIAESLKPKLKEFSPVASDADFAMSLFALISRMKMAMVTPSMLNAAVEEGKVDDNRLVSKLSDIALIYSEYENHFSDELYDPRDALTRLAKELPQKEFFKNTCVFIDGYYTFTQQEYEVIKHIISQSSNTYVSFNVDSTRAFFEENVKAAKRVRSLSSRGCEDVLLAEPRRFVSDELRFVERNIWTNNGAQLNSNDGSVHLIAAKNRFDEAEAAASEILAYVRAGGRYKDITVIAGNTDTYQSIVDSVFSRGGIPCYMSAKEPLPSKSLFSFLLASLSVVTEDFSLKSIKRYIKSGYTDLTASEADVLLGYAASWKLRGKAWYGDEEWTLDPEGYRESDISSRGAKLLLAANRARHKLVPPLAALRETLNQKGLTVSKGLRALYDHLMVMEADERLRSNAERALKNGEREKSEREIQLWKLLINIIDQLDSVCGEREVTPKRLLSLIRMMCDCYSLGAIPASADSVTFGSASLIRAGGSKMVIILGACDGEFPSSAAGSNFFDRVEATRLEEVGLQLADSLETQLNTNRFLVYAALSAPSERLVLLYPRSELNGNELRPSAAWLSVTKLLPDVPVTDFSDSDMLYSREAVSAYFPSLADCALKEEIALALRQTKTPFFRDYPSVKQPESRINFADSTLKLSPSRFERYVLCPFSYFGEYLLDLKEKKNHEFAALEMGNFIHKILDRFMSECVIDGVFKAPEDSVRRQRIRTFSDEYLKEVMGDSAKEDKRLMHIFNNMVKTVENVSQDLCAEFSDSEFVPSGFEFKIGMGDADIPAIEYNTDGKSVLLRGSIDRVDTYVRDGVRYARVVDYKSYNKELSVELAKRHGVDTQMLHYLFAYCQKTDSKPAGAMYYKASLPNVTVTGKETPDEISKEIAKSFKRDGIVLNDGDIVRAMNKNDSFLPVRFNSDGTLRKSKRLLTESDFRELSELLDGQVVSLAKNVFNGNMDISPNDCDGKKDPCDYCTLADICRMKNDKEKADDELQYGSGEETD